MHDLVSAMARYFDLWLSFIGQGMHIFLSTVSIRVAWLPTQYKQSGTIEPKVKSTPSNGLYKLRKEAVS